MKIIYSKQAKEQLYSIKEYINKESLIILAIYKYVDFDEKQIN